MIERLRSLSSLSLAFIGALITIWIYTTNREPVVIPSSSPSSNIQQGDITYVPSNKELIFHEQSYGRPDTSLFDEEKQILRDGETTIYHKNYHDEIQKENATLFTLVRNTELYDLLPTIRNFEDRFNKKFHYGWIFANDEPFNDDFMKQIRQACSGSVTFIHLPQWAWGYPDFIDQKKAAYARRKMLRLHVKYGESESYRHMCHFFSGKFFLLDELKSYRYYWRIEPDVEFRCSINYDPFKVMRTEHRYYGFNIALLELHLTVPTLWKTILNYMKEYPDRISNDNNFEFLTDDGGKSYNMCHFWSNFEIGDLDFFRSDTYTHFFNYIDHAGGIYYERWGDAPIHSFAVSILLPHNRLRYFSNTGYYHSPLVQCDGTAQMLRENDCICQSKDDFSWSGGSCLPKIFDIHEDWQRPFYASNRKYLPIHDERLRKITERRMALEKEGMSKEEIDKTISEELQQAEKEAQNKRSPANRAEARRRQRRKMKALRQKMEQVRRKKEGE